MLRAKLDLANSQSETMVVRVRDGELLDASPSFFRSEENVPRWEDFNPESERQIKPVEQYAKIFSAALFLSRLNDNFVHKSGEYFQELSGLLASEWGWTW